MGEELIDISGVWPQWHTVDRLGEGSYGSVYRIEKDDYGIVTSSALKVISIPHDEDETRELESSGMDDDSIRTFYQSRLNSIANEIRTMESLKSAPKVVSIEDYFIEEMKDSIGWRIYIRMELLKPLTDYIREKGMLTEQEVVNIGADICTALSYCEKQNIIHRDIKPSNIFLDKFGSYKLGDFGIARQLSQDVNSVHSIRGTSKYMAPEVMRGDKYNGSVDIYSLGILMYRYLNHNRYPFEPPAGQPLTQEDIDNALRRRMSGQNIPMPDGCSSKLGMIVVKACQADPSKRYAHADEMLADLRQYMRQTQSMGPGPGTDGQDGYVPSGNESAPASGSGSYESGTGSGTGYGGYTDGTGNGTGLNYGSDNGSGYVHGSGKNYGSDNGSGYVHGSGANYGSDNGGGYVHGSQANYGSDKSGGYVQGPGTNYGNYGVNYGGYGDRASANYSDNGTNFRTGNSGSGYGTGGNGYGNQAPSGSGSNGYGGQVPSGSGSGNKKSGVPAGIIVLAVLLLIGGLFFAYLGMTGGTSTKDGYKIRYNAAGGTGTMKVQQLSKKNGGTLNKNTYSYEGMHFGGWSYSADAEDPDLEDGAKISSEALKEHADGDTVTLYALWNKDKDSKGNSELGKNVRFEKYPLLSAKDADGNNNPACVYMTVENGNHSEVSVTIEIRYYGSDGTPKDTEEVNIEHLAAGEQKLAFSDCGSSEEKIKSVDCEVYVWPERTDAGYTSADDLDITIEETKRTRDSVTFKITNTGSREAEHLDFVVFGLDKDQKVFGGSGKYYEKLGPDESQTFVFQCPIEISKNDTFIKGFADGLHLAS